MSTPGSSVALLEKTGKQRIAGGSRPEGRIRRNCRGQRGASLRRPPAGRELARQAIAGLGKIGIPGQALFEPRPGVGRPTQVVEEHADRSGVAERPFGAQPRRGLKLVDGARAISCAERGESETDPDFRIFRCDP